MATKIDPSVIFNLKRQIEKTPWAVLKCRYQNNPPIPPGFPAFDEPAIDRLFTPAGAGTWNIPRFFSDVSHGYLDLSGSKVFGWITLPVNYNAATDVNRDPNVLMPMAITVAQAQGIDLSPFFGIVFTFGVPVGGSWGWPAGPGSQAKAWGDYRWVQDNGTASWGHEMGHGYGLTHAREDGSEEDYQDRWDVMSYMNNMPAVDPDFTSRGPGLNAAYMRRHGWLDPNRVWRGPETGYDEVVVLRPLYRRDLSGPLVAEFPPADSGLLVEFRIAEDWDAGLPRSAVLVHAFRGAWSYLMHGTTGQPDLAKGDRFGISTSVPWVLQRSVEVLDIDDTAKTATVRLIYNPPGPLPHYETWTEIIGSVAVGGGGAYIRGGKVVPVPPWDPMARALRHLESYQAADAVAPQLARTVKSDALRRMHGELRAMLDVFESGCHLPAAPAMKRKSSTRPRRRAKSRRKS